MNDMRKLALNCTAKKIAYRQSKDGIVISFLIHHAEMPDELAIADLGTPYVLALVEVDDNDQPLPTAKDVRGILKPVPQPAKEQPAPGAEPLPARADAVRRAGYLCKDKRFQAFLKEEFAGGWKLMPVGTDEDKAVAFARWRCGVQSRSEIKNSPEAYARWQELDAAYQAWLTQ